MRTHLTATATCVFSYDENEANFRDSLESYQEIFDEDATINDMLKHIHGEILTHGFSRNIEAIGFICPDWEEWKEVSKPHSGITMSGGFDDFTFEIHRGEE